MCDIYWFYRYCKCDCDFSRNFIKDMLNFSWNLLKIMMWFFPIYTYKLLNSIPRPLRGFMDQKSRILGLAQHLPEAPAASISGELSLDVCMGTRLSQAPENPLSGDHCTISSQRMKISKFQGTGQPSLPWEAFPDHGSCGILSFHDLRASAQHLLLFQKTEVTCLGGLLF